MRPDEHKKKKSAAYKKKHGITKGVSEKKDEKTKQEKDKSTGDGKNEPQTRKGSQAKTQLSASGSQRQREGGKVTSEAKVENSSSCTSSSDTETEAASKKKPSKSFQRREVVSNWQKYELQPDEDEKISARGENYEKLLSMSGEAISHFRFKDELSWDDLADSASESCNDTYSQFLSVNPADLVQSLACLPVHQILGISQDVFPAEQLSSMLNMAEDRKSAHTTKILLEEREHFDKDGSMEESHSSRCQTQLEIDQQNELISSLRLKVKDQSAFAVTSEKERVETATSLDTPDALHKTPAYTDNGNCDFKTETVINKGLSTFRSDNTLKQFDEKLQLEDDDLDELLFMDSPAAEVAADVSETSSHMQSTMAGSTPKDNTLQSSTTGGKSEPATESADLEAWLDSVLDD